ncbi:arylsulfatase [Verticillium alfalfae VaMs.102]|uniref:Arylsulfatase n=1 Tax=Verticillium alfalfae (strain VaMs.102 / ATCC MYA-4576 / FGSC 10136) TaxID=526221 RepID=C9SEL2_VERA1|nr:arylsulfatase [Verticillium alfalfae VaMs.102]EEY16605.1 arylsulfatase [Verticillium alfalfae VaMs.102]
MRFLQSALASTALMATSQVVTASQNQTPLLGPTTEHGAASRPNIVFVLTDDQDLHMNSLAHIPLIQDHLVKQGTLYKRHFCTTAICCPSRASLWTGKLAHNTNVTDLNPPYGGFPIFVKNGHNENYLPVWLQSAGYTTYYTGKMFNAHTIWNYDSPHLNGWNGSDFLLDPNTYAYWNATFQRNKDAPVNHLGQYSTDLVAQKAYGFLDDAVAAGEPFFLGIAPIAPHSNVNASTLNPVKGPDEDVPVSDGEFRVNFPQPAKRHEHLFPDAKVPRTENFNPDKPSGADWVRRQPKLSDENVAYNDLHYRGRLQALQAVDELVDGLIDKLEEHGVLDNTYIFFTTDNGFHISQHRLQPGKECGYEEDINIPLIVRGPGVPKGAISESVTAHIDLVPTILNLADAPLRADFDGAPIPLSSEELEAAPLSREHVNIEYWGWAISEGKWGFNGGDDKRVFNNTYKAIRVIGEGYNLYYSIWCTNEHELYDLNTDPGQLRNLLHSEEIELAAKSTILGYSLQKVLPRLDALLFVLKSCKGVTCSQPWRSLHPQGGVTTLREALSPQFDNFYVQQVKVEYNRCELGHIIAAEGPQFEAEGDVYWKGQSWSEWT